MRILVIEDEYGIASLLKTGLESEYFVVDVAADGETGSYLARTNEYDLIILDNMLPKKIRKGSLLRNSTGRKNNTDHYTFCTI